MSMSQALSARIARLVMRSRNRPMSTRAPTASTTTLTPSLEPKPSLLRTAAPQAAMARCLSMTPLRDLETNGGDYGATKSLPPLPPQDHAEDLAAYAHANRHHKVRPFIFKRRVKQLRFYVGEEKGIRHSPWRMNLVCQFAAGLTVPEALRQLMFCRKSRAPLLARVVRRTAAEADAEDGLQPSQLEVAECFATHGTHLKRLKIMGRGRSGTKRRRHSHIRLVLREIDFPSKLVRAESVNQKRKWLGLLRKAREDYEGASAEREELAELEAMAAKLEEDAKKEEEERDNE